MLGTRIKEARKASGFTTERLAEAVGTTQQAVKNWEAGRRQPTVDNLVAHSARRLVAPLTGCYAQKEERMSFQDEIHRLREQLRQDKLQQQANFEQHEAKVDARFERMEPGGIEVPSERFLLELLGKQQDLIAEQTALLERQRQDTSRLTEVLAKQQELLISERVFQRKLVERDLADLRAEVESLKAELERRPQRRTSHQS